MFLLKKIIHCYNKNIDMKYFVKEDLTNEISKHLCLKENRNKYEYENPIRSVQSTFVVEHFVITRKPASGLFRLDLKFNIPKAYIGTHLYHTEKKLSSVSECVDKLMNILWEFRPCRECLYNLTPGRYCNACSIYNVINEYGMEENKITEIPTCTICMEEVLHCRLHCGHHFHAACLIQINPKPYLHYHNEEEAIKCPNCRDKLDLTDYRNIFLYEELDQYTAEIDQDGDEDSEDDDDDDESEDVSEDEDTTETEAEAEADTEETEEEGSS